ncbi:acyltransferase [Pseudomonas cannabina]|uniref:Transferase, hexapeptide repeat-containing protein n=1 Tax=Pseudomonas cannabina TaxID=86840 RepID=A0A0P9LB86_PSECA|nr:acyltransferase [Pseudomonas cannabina]KAA8708996.1 acyltransferase [Pseudomonas cannabina]KPW71521.1 Transferase, hexapeptide repeat-containing protein [Pseudomonas cannabina]RMN42711.1 Transferase, hexapeptide repeat-containing protein [Pseudomonas cannabina]SDQ72828.1 transferase hexapeptide (six repeat-containing protein) [Pseudomonas cannabina]
MKHRMLHSHNLREALPDYARKMAVPLEELEAAYQWMLDNEVCFETRIKERTLSFICYLNIEPRIEHPLARRFYKLLASETLGALIPLYGINWPTLRDRMLRVWEQTYNILICKIPSHTLRLLWLRMGGAKIGKGSTVWRNTEVLGVDSLRIGNDTTVGWHCQLDARGGLVIGDHVTIASHVLIIAGGHDLNEPEFWAVGGPVFIGDYAWICSRALLSFGADIGEGAVVGGNSVVSKPVAPYVIVSGPNAEVKGERARNLNYKVGGKGLFTLFH